MYVVLPLYLLNFYVLEDDLLAMATDLMICTEEARRVVKYVTALQRLEVAKLQTSYLLF